MSIYPLALERALYENALDNSFFLRRNIYLSSNSCFFFFFVFIIKLKSFLCFILQLVFLFVLFLERWSREKRSLRNHDSLTTNYISSSYTQLYTSHLKVKRNPKIKANCWDYFRNKLPSSRSAASSFRRMTQLDYWLVRFWWWFFCCYRRPSSGRLSKDRGLQRVKRIEWLNGEENELTLNVGADCGTSSDCRHHSGLMNASRCRKDQRTHRLHRVFHENPWMSLFYLVLTVAVHADDAVHVRLLHEIKVFLLDHRRWRHQRLNIFHHRCLLLKRCEEALLLLLLCLDVRYLMSHLKIYNIIANFPEFSYQLTFLCPST